MFNPEQFLLPPLFIKPLVYPGGLQYETRNKQLNKTIGFRSFDLDKDLDIIFDWVNRDYALKYWQLDGNKERVYNTYYNIQRNGNAHSYIGLLDNEPVCQFDIYRVLADEIKQYVFDANEHDCGFHLIMAPLKTPIHGLSTMLIKAMLDYYFSFPDAKRMFAEPDTTNRRSNFLLKQAGFSFIQSIEMSYKTANLYVLHRNEFHH